MGIVLNKWTTADWSIRLHTSPTDFLCSSGGDLVLQEVSANIILPHAIEFALRETESFSTLGQSIAYFLDPAIPSIDYRGYVRPVSSFWLTVWGGDRSDASNTKLQLTLSCLDWTLGTYPIFLWSPEERDSLEGQRLDRYFTSLCQALSTIVNKRRVFSAFGRADLVRAFSRAWISIAKMQPEHQTFYEANLSYCTKESFKGDAVELQEGHIIRPATALDLRCVSTLCQGFADSTVCILCPQDILSNSFTGIFPSYSRTGDNRSPMADR